VAQLRAAVLSSLAWTASTKYIAQGFSWICFLLVIRILDPEDFGLMAEASLIIGLFSMLGDLGVGAALIQKDNLSSDEIARNFGFLLIVNGALCVLLLSGASLIASYFNEPRLVPMLQALSAVFVLMALYALPQSVLMREMEFKARSLIELMATLVSSLTTVTAAYWGAGVWALVWGSLTLHAMFMVGYSVVSPQRVWPQFSLMGMNRFISFGGYVTAERMVWYFSTKADIVIGGKFLSSNALGIYSVAMSLASLPLEKLSPILTQVAFPAFAKIQNDPLKVGEYFLKAVRLFANVVFPVCGGIIVAAPEGIRLVLGDKWIGLVVPLQLLTLIVPLRCMGVLYSPALTGLGMPRVAFINVVINASIMTVAFIVGAWFAGLSGLCYAWGVGYLIVFVVISVPSLRCLGLSSRKLYAELLYPCAATVVMMVAVFGVAHLLGGQPDVLVLGVKVFLGMVLYLGLTVAFQGKLIDELRKLAKREQPIAQNA
jgi:teichuronic acid exporter